MLIGKPVAHDAVNTIQQPAVTAMGIFYWVASNGLRTHQEEVDRVELSKLWRVEDLLSGADKAEFSSHQHTSSENHDDLEPNHNPE